MQGFVAAALAGLALMATGGTAAQADAVFRLPPPTGPFPVGRVTYHWTDSSRPEVLAPHASARRELMVDVWYPAQPGTGSPAEYLPGFDALRRAVGDDALRREFGPAHGAVASGRVRTYAAESASFARELGRCPVLVFSHGFGVLSRLYSGQLEDLASQG
jgi:predicted dienelactone hydrolase